eukprot:CAMPEP_0171060630 /NCGR_PEP_ID=MMETSP0766_2-20121228/3953_1 /TAXON_ID=439317 /ORGANISM="Gambierdiscus australes, Strain CAWD 149" /LENGTH=332 /DNA_ID=CAMNT_0011516231 /DNA_START=87 /DNA_END=1085 /DNA_ORIENTATION=-
MENVLSVFKKCDTSGRGIITLGELKQLLSTVGADLSDAECATLAEAAGSAVNGEVTYERLCLFLGQMPEGSRPLFLDMKHSNNAARIRLWMMLKEGVQDLVETHTITYADLQSVEFVQINPLKKVPALIRGDGKAVFESFVILDYLEDKYYLHKPSFRPSTAEARQLMQLMIRCHDLYIASPNCTAPGFSHSQGAMYLSYSWHGASRGMDLPTRAAKLAEIWKQLAWLNGEIIGPYLVGDEITLADLTWFPTTIFMEFMLPRVFRWPNMFRELEGPFPSIAKWWTRLSEEPAFKKVRQDIYEYWEEMEEQGQFKPILEEMANDTSGLKFQYP